MMFRRTIKIFIPIFKPNLKDIVYFKGYVSISDIGTVIYLIEYSRHKDVVWSQSDTEKNIIFGICNGAIPDVEKRANIFQNFIYFNNPIGVPQIKKLNLNGNQVDFTDSCIVMLYEYDKIKDTGIICQSSESIMELQLLIQKHSRHTDLKERPYHEPFLKSPSWLSYTTFGQHVINYVNLLYWLFTTIRREKRISIKQGNFLLAIVMDILLGYVILQLLTLDEKEFSKMLMGVLEKLVNSLYTLLRWLMGAPAGLKLNNAFNKMLGKYFSYHTQLWWLFLDVTGEKLDVILHFFIHYIGYAGFTFQAAIISDMICIATFHSYCIYVYAARLFNIQVSGLIALFRLFLGRKYNPLRGGVDSCEYNNQELFVGTVAFTILLLLMPTTAMYYAVFTLFRFLSLVVQRVLAKLTYLIQTQPSYVFCLWLTNSSKVAGKILIEVISNVDASPVVLKLNLLTMSIQDLVSNFKPPVDMPKPVEWTNLLSNVLMVLALIRKVYDCALCTWILWPASYLDTGNSVSDKHYL